jgi:two-component system response regulator HydG
VLVVDDDRSFTQLLEVALQRRGYQATPCASAEEALQKLVELNVDVVVTDVNLTGMSGTELCREVTARRSDVPVILVTAFGSMESAVSALWAGAYDFITKPLEVDALALTLNRAVQHHSLRREVARLRKVVHDTQRYGQLLGTSDAMRGVFQLLDRVAGADATVLVSGESGTGKELVARALHQRSPRSGKPFVAVNCSALPEHLLESELFGHVKGAFTDAHESRPGLFQQAQGGTVFLDEIGELPLALQPKLLRVLQERSVRAVGADRESPLDVRVVAATNRHLEELVAERRFREDLFYRLNVIHLELPPLRTRGTDVLLLAQAFTEMFAARSGKEVAGFSNEVGERLLTYPWPGNVRELQNCIERAVALTQSHRLALEDLPERLLQHVAAGSPSPAMPLTAPGELPTMEEVERRHIQRVLRAVNGNKSQAAQVLGFDRKTLYRKLERYGELKPEGSRA